VYTYRSRLTRTLGPPRRLHSASDTDIWKMESGAISKSSLSSTRGDSNPQFSHDGGKVAFCSMRSGTWQIFVANSDGSGLTQMTSLSDSCTPRW
jgi:Tol biopolymer transport system component